MQYSKLMYPSPESDPCDLIVISYNYLGPTTSPVT